MPAYYSGWHGDQNKIKTSLPLDAIDAVTKEAIKFSKKDTF